MGRKTKRYDYGELEGRGRIILLKLLMDLEPFKERLKELANLYPDMFSVPAVWYPMQGKLIESTNKPPEVRFLEERIPADLDRRRLDEYSVALQELADRYNLKCDWILNTIHEKVRTIIKPECRELHIGVSTVSSIKRFTVDIPVFPDTREEDVIKECRKAFKEIKRNSKWIKRVREPQNIELHVKWLFRRLVYGCPGERMDFKDSRDYDPQYINQCLYQTAKLLGIRLPKGRPPRNQKAIA